MIDYYCITTCVLTKIKGETFEGLTVFKLSYHVERVVPNEHWEFSFKKLWCWCLFLRNLDEATSFKSKRDAKKKSLSSHDHNWNTLFLGVNAVADVMAEKYNTTKSGILDDASSSSLAVRMALGETQIVTETRKFLVSQGVKLDVFGQVCPGLNGAFNYLRLVPGSRRLPN